MPRGGEISNYNFQRQCEWRLLNLYPLSLHVMICLLFNEIWKSNSNIIFYLFLKNAMYFLYLSEYHRVFYIEF